ncbi:DUF5908 family protein [Pedobacter nutrimenti]|jgi:hypothetical protein|uniref:Uncharacterized protein n=1 Tax=Pedobacter nutrimenti TaxID=1241337 RepID=A0A318UM24_9SPHI|nr:DUF5908 family protein [Pedobacter nutrimenti]PYF75135.1 hypothetical protein B0O44_103584 [Pedobacter nutrimenti]
MPIEIRELVIRVVIEKHPVGETFNPEVIHHLKSEIIKECTAKIIQKIKKSTER